MAHDGSTNDLIRAKLSARKHLILGWAICENRCRKIKHLRRAQEEGFWASVSVQAAGVQSGTDLWEPSSQLARCAA